MEISSPIEISTLSFIIDINLKSFSPIDLLVLSLYLPVSDDGPIVGLSLNYLRNAKIVKRGSQSSGIGSFHNQLTLLLKINGKNKKVKIFSGGKVHICGCKSKDEVYPIYDALHELLSNLNIDEEMDLTPIGPLLVDANDCVHGDGSIIGVHDNGSVYFHNNLVFPIENDLWVSKLSKNNVQTVYNSIGEVVGTRNKKTKDMDLINFPSRIQTEKTVYLGSELAKKMYLKNVNTVLVNSRFRINGTVDKNRLNLYFKNAGYHTSYEPLIYHALKVMFYFGDNSREGICKCTNICSCTKTTSIVMGNGCILLVGFKDMDTTRKVFEWMVNHISVSGAWIRK